MELTATIQTIEGLGFDRINELHYDNHTSYFFKKEGLLIEIQNSRTFSVLANNVNKVTFYGFIKDWPVHYEFLYGLELGGHFASIHETSHFIRLGRHTMEFDKHNDLKEVVLGILNCCDKDYNFMKSTERVYNYSKKDMTLVSELFNANTVKA